MPKIAPELRCCLTLSWQETKTIRNKKTAFLIDLKLIHIHGNNYSCTDKNINPNIIELTFTNIKKIGFKQKITEKNYPIDKLDYKNIPRKKDFILKCFMV